ncbi:hypothetical protein ACFQZ4_47230 [Catellatospora coxensis]
MTAAPSPAPGDPAGPGPPRRRRRAAVEGPRRHRPPDATTFTASAWRPSPPTRRLLP